MRHQRLAVLVLGILQLFTLFSFAQSGNSGDVTGQVKDSKGNALSGVTIAVKGTKKVTQTNAEGKFTIGPVVAGKTILQFSSIGYADKEVTVGASSNISVVLNEAAKALEDMVVIGYGVQKRKDLTGAIATVNSEHMNLGGTTASVGQAIQGRAAGVLVQQSDFSPGAGMNILIRGGNSFSSTNQPLFVVDGLATDNGSFINPNDIEDIQVLKDASSTSIFGARGSNGVVMITTKKGKAGKLIVEGDASNGTQRLTYKPNQMSGSDYQSVMNAIAAENGNPPPFPPSFPTTNTNWFKLATQNASILNRSVSVSSNDKTSKIYASLNYLQQTGILRNTDMERYSLRLGGEKTLSDKARIGINFYGARTGSHLQKYSGDITAPLYGILTAPTNVPVYNPDGSFYQYLGKDNSLATLLLPTNTSVNKLFNGNVFLDYDFIKGLTYHISIGGESSQSTLGQYLPTTLVAGAANGGVASEQMFTTQRWAVEQYLTYKFRTGVHSFSIMGGTTSQADEIQSLTAGSKGFSTNLFLNNNLGAGATPYPAPTSYKGDAGKLWSLFGRLSYNFSDRFLADFTLRDDASSRFGPNHRHGFFPAAGLAWKMMDEPFISNLNTFSNLKLRISYGLTGNDRIGDLAYLSRLSSYNTVLGTSSTVSTGIEPSNLANPNLKWESTAQFDAGLDMGFVQGRINATIDVYRKRTNDLLLAIPTGQWWGFSSQISNVGSIENKGIELSINTENVRTKEFTWSTTFNIAYNKQKCIKLADNVKFIPSNTANPSGVVSAQEFTRLMPGMELGVIYGYKYAGVIKSGEHYAPQPNSKPGDPKYEDLTGDGKITPDDRTWLGNTTPHYVAGFSNDLHYKGIDLNIFLQGAFGYHLYNMNRLVLESTTGADNLHRWVAGVNENTSVPRQGYFLTKYGSYVNSRFVENASYVRLKQVSIGYNIPAGLIKRLKFIENLKIYASGQNLLTLTKYSGTDPEVNVHGGNNPVGGVLTGTNNIPSTIGTFSNTGGGLDFNSFPAFRTFIVGVKLAIH